LRCARGDTNRVPPAFVPVVVSDRSTRDTSLALEFSGGRVLRLPESIPAQRLAELVHALEAADSPWRARTPR
jgi:hypothetical protein